jgi:hypothetical protein
VGKILDRMSELRVMTQDVTKNSSDIENYSKEFVDSAMQRTLWNSSLCLMNSLLRLVS